MTTLLLPPHAAHPFFTVEGDHLCIAGRSIVDVARQAGRTPFYAYSAADITRRVEHLRELFSPEVQFHYSIKANPMPAVVRHVSKLVDGVDVASGGELKIALEAGVRSTHISFAGPGKRPEELAEAVAAGVILNIESETELRRVAQIAHASGNRPRVAVRVNPAFELRGAGMKMGGGAKPFGVDADRVPDLLKEMARLPVELTGFHIFSGSQSLNSAAIVEAQQRSVALAVELAQFAPTPVRTVSVGGGFGIPYFPTEQPLDVAAIANPFRQLAETCRRQLEANFVVELGRYLVGEAGLYVSTIVDRKKSCGRVFLVTDGGLHQHLAASGNFGQVLRRNYPVTIGNRVNGEQRERATIVGPLCTPLDIIADQVDIARAQVDDLVVVLQSGAYGMTASPLRFLSHPPPIELLV